MGISGGGLEGAEAPYFDCAFGEGGGHSRHVDEATAGGQPHRRGGLCTVVRCPRQVDYTPEVNGEIPPQRTLSAEGHGEVENGRFIQTYTSSQARISAEEPKHHRIRGCRKGAKRSIVDYACKFTDEFIGDLGGSNRSGLAFDVKYSDILAHYNHED